MFDFSHILGQYTHPSFFGGGMNLGGYQNNLGPWNMQGGQGWQGAKPPPWWQGHDPSNWQSSSGWPMSGPAGQQPNQSQTSPAGGGSEGGPWNMSGPISAGAGAGGMDFSSISNLLNHVMPGSAPNGQMPSVQDLFKGLLSGSFHAPNITDMVKGVAGGGGNFQSPNIQGLVGNMFGGQGASNPNPTVPTAPSPSAFIQNSGR